MVWHLSTIFAKVVTQLLRAEVRNEIVAGLCLSLNKKKRSQSDSNAVGKHQITQSAGQRFLYFLLYLETLLMPPHFCTTTRVGGTWRSLLGEKKVLWEETTCVTQSVSLSDRQTECTLFPPGDWGQAESPCSRHSNSPGSLSCLGKTTDAKQQSF